MADAEKPDPEAQLRMRELDLREREIELAARRERGERWRSPLTVAVIAAALAGFSNAYIAYANSQSELRLETTRAESARILEVLKIGEPNRVRENLAFLVQLGLVQSDELKQRIEAWNADPDRARVYLSPAAVAAFQREQGMPADGIAGPATRARMREAETERRRRQQLRRDQGLPADGIAGPATQRRQRDAGAEARPDREY